MPKNYQSMSHYWAQIEETNTFMVPVYYSGGFTYQGISVSPYFVGDQIKYPKVTRHLKPELVKDYKSQIEPIIKKLLELILKDNLTILKIKKEQEKEKDRLVKLLKIDNEGIFQNFERQMNDLVLDYSFLERFEYDSEELEAKNTKTILKQAIDQIFEMEDY